MINKEQMLDALYNQYKKCLECPLAYAGRSSIVFGEGNIDAMLMFIGEGPGAQEDLLSRPFVGRSGRLLTATIEKLGYSRQDVYITNIVKCRPPNNRPPTTTEIATCTTILLFEQIKIINPMVICTLGSTALTGLTQGQHLLKNVRGTSFIHHDRVVIPTYHPAYILRNQSAYPLFFKDISNAFLASKNF